jgi:hypothetical protein
VQRGALAGLSAYNHYAPSRNARAILARVRLQQQRRQRPGAQEVLYSSGAIGAAEQRCCPPQLAVLTRQLLVTCRTTPPVRSKSVAALAPHPALAVRGRDGRLQPERRLAVRPSQECDRNNADTGPRACCNANETTLTHSSSTRVTLNGHDQNMARRCRDVMGHHLTHAQHNRAAERSRRGLRRAGGQYVARIL